MYIYTYCLSDLLYGNFVTCKKKRRNAKVQQENEEKMIIDYILSVRLNEERFSGVLSFIRVILTLHQTGKCVCVCVNEFWK